MNGNDESRGLRLGSLFGTTMHVEVSFIILSALFVLLALERKAPLQLALLWIPVLFVSVLLHELGHATMIGLLGFGSSRISLSGFGGVTVNERRAKPWENILISAAGPLTSLGISLVLGLLAAFVPQAQRDPMLAAFIPRMVEVNLFWAIFNLMPVYPLDGGQVVENAARIVFSARRAIILSAWISIIAGVAIIIFAVLQQALFMAVIAAMLVVQNYRRLRALGSGADREE